MSELNGTAVTKCTNCGADMVFDPTLGKLKCPYCDSTRHIDRNVALIRDFYGDRRSGDVVEGTVTYHCPNCDGMITLENFATTAKCPFCGATNIIKIDELPGLKPDSILPFAVSKENALQSGKKWMNRQIFAPSKLRKNFKADNFSGMYTPSFLFSADTQSSYVGRLGEHYTVMVGTGKNRHAEVRTRWFDVSGVLPKIFRDVVVESSSKITQKQMRKILPFDSDNIESYKREYLSGFCAERYDTSLDDSFEVAKVDMEASIKAAILAKYTYDVVDYLNVSTSYPTVKFHYSLLPIWICGYKFKEKLYNFLVNGRTGKSAGKAPLSPFKVALAVLLGLGIIAAVVVLYLFYGGDSDSSANITSCANLLLQ